MILFVGDLRTMRAEIAETERGAHAAAQDVRAFGMDVHPAITRYEGAAASDDAWFAAMTGNRSI